MGTPRNIECQKIAHSKPVDKVAHSLVDTLPPTAIISTYQTNQIMNSETATDLILFLQDMSSDNDNQAPDLELATDYLESVSYTHLTLPTNREV